MCFRSFVLKQYLLNKFTAETRGRPTAIKLRNLATDFHRKTQTKNENLLNHFYKSL